MEFCVFLRIIFDLKYRILNYGKFERRWHVNIDINLLKPTGYLMNQQLTFKNFRLHPHFICFVLISERGAYRFLVGKPEGKGPLRRRRRRWMHNVGMDLQELEVGMWTELGWTLIGICGGLLWMRYWTFGFNKRRSISYVASNLLDSEDGLCTIL